jgi:hypothetical protein
MFTHVYLKQGASLLQRAVGENIHNGFAPLPASLVQYAQEGRQHDLLDLQQPILWLDHQATNTDTACIPPMMGPQARNQRTGLINPEARHPSCNGTTTRNAETLTKRNAPSTPSLYGGRRGAGRENNLPPATFNFLYGTHFRTLQQGRLAQYLWHFVS